MKDVSRFSCGYGNDVYVQNYSHNDIGMVFSDTHCSDSTAHRYIVTQNSSTNTLYTHDELFPLDYDHHNITDDDICYISFINSSGYIIDPVYDDEELLYADDVQFHPAVSTSHDDTGPPEVLANVCVNNVSSVNDISKQNFNDATDLHCHKYGFIAQGHVTPSNQGHSVVLGDGIDWLKQVRDIISATGVANYKRARIQIPSKFNFSLWLQMLGDYEDLQIVEYLRFGFPLSIVKGFTATANKYNHSSATKFPQHVQDYLNDEITEKAMLGPFKDHPLDNYHISPIMSRPKSVDKRRIIIDLSWKLENSINYNITSHYDGTAYTLRYPSLDIIQERIVHLGLKACIFKIDISRAFRNLPVDPIDVNLLGLYWDEHYYVDLSIPFGYIHGSACCQRVTDAIRYICSNHNIFLFNYCDDLIGVELSHKVDSAFRFTKDLVHNLGFPINVDKLVAPAAIVTCLGIQISVVDMSCRVPPDKLVAIKALCSKWVNKKVVSRKQFQSLLGKLLYICKCVRYARIFMGRMLATFRNGHKSALIYLDSEFFKDLNWFNMFLNTFNGCVFINKQEHFTLYVDASFMGIGGIFNNNVYAYHIPDCAKYSIVHLELINVLVAVRRWSMVFANSVVKVYCDNASVVAALNNYRIKDDLMLLMVRNIWLELATHNIELMVHHIPGVNNTYADILSRWGARHKFRENDIDYLLNYCQWYNIHDSMFYLNTHI